MIEGKLDLASYMLLLADRRVKLDYFEGDGAYRNAYARGDADADFVPDSMDRCPGTPRGATTDEQGCEFDCTRDSPGRSTLVS